MNETLEIFDRQGNLLESMDREAFYQEIKEEYKNKGSISKQVKSIRLVLMNSDGRIYLQKRSKIKAQNPGLYDKTVGGHVAARQTWEIAVIKECAEELGFPAAVLTPPEFDHAVRVTDLKVVGLFREVDYKSNYQSTRIENNQTFVQPFMTKFYIGYYDGSIKFSDGESSGIEVFSLEELKEELANNPNKFTEDVKFILQNYEGFLTPIK
ncbi:MAG: NUDIX domain-containing protein [bacterium]|nr:NUDIX domain-containing protein [bacterium]